MIQEPEHRHLWTEFVEVKGAQKVIFIFRFALLMVFNKKY